MAESGKTRLTFKISDGQLEQVHPFELVVEAQLEQVHPMAVSDATGSSSLVLETAVPVKKVSVVVDENGDTFLTLED